jgi:uncharacterized protein
MPHPALSPSADHADHAGKAGAEGRRPLALVTGASSGIGRALALGMAARGYDLVVTARREALLESLAEHIGRAHGKAVEVVTADLTDRSDLGRVIERASRVDVLVANAGFSTRGSFPDLPLAAELAEIELNIASTVALCRAAAPHMCQQRHGRILITSSAASFQPLPGLATYGATKSFLTSFSRALDGELRRFDVTVTCLAPGFTATEETEERPGPGFLWSNAAQVADAGIEAMLAGRPLVIPGSPWRIAAALAPRLPAALTVRVATYIGGRMIQG